MAVFFNHTPQLLFANSKIDGCLGYGQGIFLTNSHIVFFQSLSSFLVPYLNLSSVSYSSQGKPDIHFSRCSGCSECHHCYNSRNALCLAGPTDVEKWVKNRVNFLRVSPSLLGSLRRGRLPPEVRDRYAGTISRRKEKLFDKKAQGHSI